MGIVSKVTLFINTLNNMYKTTALPVLHLRKAYIPMPNGSILNDEDIIGEFRC